MTRPLVRPGVMEIAPYVGGESSVPGMERVIKLASNESALGPSPLALAAFREAAAKIHRYPDGSCSALRKALADRYNLDIGRIVCGAGSDELIGLLCRAYAGPGDEVMYTEHGFLMYPIAARATGATPLAVREANLTADVGALLKGVTPRTRVVFLANPNNPTGTYLPASELARLREGLPKRVLLVVDAAYAEFVLADDYTWGGDLVEADGNVVVTRTFSKIFGLAALRLGWAYCPTAVADALHRLRNPFNVAGPAQAAGIAALSDAAFVERARAHNERWRAWTAEKLRALGLDVPQSVCNFVLVRFPAASDDNAAATGTAAAADAFLKSRGIIARRMDAYGLAGSLRVSIGLEEEMRALVAALADFVADR